MAVPHLLHLATVTRLQLARHARDFVIPALEAAPDPRDEEALHGLGRPGPSR